MFTNTTSLPATDLVQKNDDGIPRLNNEFIKNSADDCLYHFGIFKSDTSTVAKFSNIKFVCTGGSAKRMGIFAENYANEFMVEISGNLSNTDRYAMYITGPVLWINHGMGVPSLSIMLIEVIKLLYYAKATNVKFIRIGTCGGVGVDPGTLIVSSGTMNALFQQKHRLIVHGKIVEHDSKLDEKFSNQLFTTAQNMGLPAQRGLTFCTDDFYEGQMRLDGLFCDFESQDKTDFLMKIHGLGVRNIEMESVGFAAYTHRAKIPAAIVCVAVVNRIISDQIALDSNLYKDFEMRPFRVVSTFINAECGTQTLSPL